ncbi:MAG: pyridoxamine 5'-phosphate oxidase family protein [Acidobacteria bacterium]|nr:pyridoxamine 5'-phosphate oxidase family protein [Acidobacteriota bacterium]
MVLHAPGPFSRDRLDRTSCRKMLENAEFARVVLSVRCLPSAHVVRCEVADDTIYLASDEHDVIAAARHSDVVTVQADGVDSEGRRWSVQATGLAYLATHDDLRLAATPRSLLYAPRGLTGAVIGVPMTLLRGTTLE